MEIWDMDLKKLQRRSEKKTPSMCITCPLKMQKCLPTNRCSLPPYNRTCISYDPIKT
uniref:Uncharacterized protein n=1 Tax=Oryza brachyantha TaxID=4533 RepID=J3LDF2_ORYBR